MKSLHEGHLTGRQYYKIQNTIQLSSAAVKPQLQVGPADNLEGSSRSDQRPGEHSTSGKAAALLL